MRGNHSILVVALVATWMQLGAAPAPETDEQPQPVPAGPDAVASISLSDSGTATVIEPSATNLNVTQAPTESSDALIRLEYSVHSMTSVAGLPDGSLCGEGEVAAECSPACGLFSAGDQTRSVLLEFGGSYRARYHKENNIRRAGLTGVDDEFVLHQTRLWVDGAFGDHLRIRAGYIDAASFGESVRPRGNEVNRSDLYQLYADVDLPLESGELTARLGRQEMKYGSARLIMAPVWANRRRSHDGIRLMWKPGDWEVDAFWVRPIFRNPDHFRAFDSTNHDQQLYGIFGQRAALDNSDFELYWLAFDVERGAGAPGGRYDTIGSRLYGEEISDWLYEIEGGVQFGTNPDDSPHTAGFMTSGIGRRFDGAPGRPEVWAFYDWASGSDTTGNGFHHYVQRAHYYLGNLDLFGRRNLQDANLRLTVHPTDELTLTAWYHYFQLATGRDVPYNLNMRPFAGLSAGDAGDRELGHELDLTLTWQASDEVQVRLGYAYFRAGRFYDTTPGVPTNADASLFYSHITYSF